MIVNLNFSFLLAQNIRKIYSHFADGSDRMPAVVKKIHGHKRMLMINSDIFQPYDSSDKNNFSVSLGSSNNYSDSIAKYLNFRM